MDSRALTTGNRITILNVKIDVVNIDQILHRILLLCESDGPPALINHVNSYSMYLSMKDTEFRSVLNQSDVVYCDGYGVRLAATFLRKAIGPRMSAPDWIDRFFEVVVQAGKAVFFLGDTAEIVSEFAKMAKHNHDRLIIRGYHDGFFHGRKDATRLVVDQINQANCDILLVGMGMPLQEKWVFRNREKLKVKVIITVGGLLRYYAGFQYRGPRWLTDNGLEWFFRLLIQPKKTWKRYMVGLPIFYCHVLAEKMDYFSITNPFDRDKT